MNEPKKSGRPKKHPAEDLHFKPASETGLSGAESDDSYEEDSDSESSLANGWNLIEEDISIKSPPRNGLPVRLSEKPEGDGILAFWKRLRAFANSTKRWQETGAWFDFHNGQQISFEPKYWKERF